MFFSFSAYQFKTMSTPGDSSSRRSGGGAVPASTSRAPTPSDAATEGAGTDVVEIDDDVEVGDKKKLRLKSKVWEDFDKINVGGKWKAKCHWCKKLLTAEGKSGTSHLQSHINTCESRQSRKGLKQCTLKLSKNQDGSVVVEKYAFDQDVARKELALMICVHEYPLSMVDHVGFRKFCAAMQPLFKVVSRNTIRKDILDMYEVQKINMVNQFQQEDSRIAVTTDMWTANHQKKGYMAVIVHYIDENWRLKSYLLR
jgi:hypothetical protein